MNLVFSFKFRYTGQRPKEIPSIITHATVDPSVEEIPMSAFANHQSLRGIELPSTLKKIGDSAFYLCKALVDLQLPPRVSSIGDMCFFRCESLRSVSIPANVKSIGVVTFEHCHSLTDVHLPEGLKFIHMGAFSHCEALSAIALPSTLEEVKANAFANCKGLLGVEIPKNTSMKIESAAFLGCSALVNVSIPSSNENVEPGTFSGHLLEEATGSTSWLQDRYTHLPLHEACYHASVLTRTSLTQVLDDLPNAPIVWEDDFNMTPLHVLATSANLKVGALECLLDNLPLEILFRKDKQGKKMLDHLLRNTCPNALHLVQTVIQKAIVDEISTWVLGNVWETNLSDLVVQMIYYNGDTNNISTRYKQLEKFLSQVGQCTRVEMTSLMELSLWKLRMDMVNKEEEEEIDSYYRERCHCQSGAEVVIRNVVGYLWLEGAKSDTALSVFPLCSEVNPES